jgi:DNA-directed RNA polymerase subunit RPC12/RpoP
MTDARKCDHLSRKLRTSGLVDTYICIVCGEIFFDPSRRLSAEYEKTLCLHTNYRATSVPGEYMCRDCGTILIADFDNNTDVLFEYELGTVVHKALSRIK